ATYSQGLQAVQLGPAERTLAGELDGRAGGQHEAEATSASGLRVELDPASERASELPSDRQPETGPLRVRRDKGAEDPLGVVSGDPGAAVRDLDAHGAVARL